RSLSPHKIGQHRAAAAPIWGILSDAPAIGPLLPSSREGSMVRRVLVALAIALAPLAGIVATTAASAGTACTSLAALTIPNVTIKSASAVGAGAFTPPGAQSALTLPAFCRVEATAHPTSDSDIKFEVWIPPAEAWNGKLEAVGNGGYSGAISYPAMATAL